MFSTGLRFLGSYSSVLSFEGLGGGGGVGGRGGETWVNFGWVCDFGLS